MRAVPTAVAVWVLYYRVLNLQQFHLSCLAPSDFCFLPHMHSGPTRLREQSTCYTNWTAQSRLAFRKLKATVAMSEKSKQQMSREERLERSASSPAQEMQYKQKQNKNHARGRALVTCGLS